jgi:hypothetical protein
LTVVSFLVIASRMQKVDLITWQDDDAIESVHLGNLVCGATAAPAAIRRSCACNVASLALRPSRAERVAEDLENEILCALPTGRAHLGSRSDIMDRFGISPTVLNETLRTLASAVA